MRTNKRASSRSKGSTLTEYARKRDFGKTSEPPSGHPGSATLSRTGESSGNLFVIQKHAASRLHYDFRLEMEGALKSWAVPKGIPYQKGEKHLAIHVEDHPLDYARFEGIIPKGEYGGGTVMVWDIGRYQVSGDHPIAALDSGKLHLCLEGMKLRGEWTLIRTHMDQGDDKETWMLIKTGDSMNILSPSEDDTSVLSGRKMGQISAEKDAVWTGLKRTEPIGVKHASGKSPGFVQPMKAKLVESMPEDAGWIFELKFDGYRALAIKEKRSVQLYSRNEKPLLYPAIADAVAALPCENAIFDGEIVAIDPEGHPSFQLLQSPEDGPICYYLFDLLFLEGNDLRKRPLSERKELLASLIAQAETPLRFSAGLVGQPQEILAQIKARGLEGIVAKRAQSMYESGQRSGAWVKIKCLNEQEFVIGGCTPPKGTRSYFGALLVGYYDEKNQLRFAGKVGTGFSEKLLSSLNREFTAQRIDSCPFSDLPYKGTGRFSAGLSAAQMKQCLWVKPELVCQVKFTEWTRDGKLRQPVFMGLRPDKTPSEVVRERS